jgi:hypothetical protein
MALLSLYAETKLQRSLQKAELQAARVVNSQQLT